MQATIAAVAAIIHIFVSDSVSATRIVKSNGFDCYKVEDNGYSYRGLVDFSNSGRPCQNWLDVGEVSPVGDNGIGNHNYCRNPDQSFDSPWCFTNDGSGLSKEQCGVDECEDEQRDFEAEAEALKRYMGGRGCECPDLFLHSVSNLSSLPLLFSKGACSGESGRCSLTAVVENHCRCAVKALHGVVRVHPAFTGSNITVLGQTGQTRSVNVSVMSHSHVFLASRSIAAGPDVSSAQFAGDCNSACYGSACAKCGHCIAKCQQGPHPYCKIDSKKELWFAMCGQASEEQLLAGMKQCGDPVPTGCASR